MELSALEARVLDGIQAAQELAHKTATDAGTHQPSGVVVGFSSPIMR